MTEEERHMLNHTFKTVKLKNKPEECEMNDEYFVAYKNDIKERVAGFEMGWCFHEEEEEYFQLKAVHEDVIRSLLGYFPTWFLDEFLRAALDELVDEGILGYAAFGDPDEGGCKDELDLRTINCPNYPPDDRFYFNVDQLIDSINKMKEDLMAFKKAIGG